MKISEKQIADLLQELDQIRNLFTKRTDEDELRMVEIIETLTDQKVYTHTPCTDGTKQNYSFS